MYLHLTGNSKLRWQNCVRINTCGYYVHYATDLSTDTRRYTQKQSKRLTFASVGVCTTLPHHVALFVFCSFIGIWNLQYIVHCILKTYHWTHMKKALSIACGIKKKSHKRILGKISYSLTVALNFFQCNWKIWQNICSMTVYAVKRCQSDYYSGVNWVGSLLVVGQHITGYTAILCTERWLSARKKWQKKKCLKLAWFYATIYN